MKPSKLREERIRFERPPLGSISLHNDAVGVQELDKKQHKCRPRSMKSLCKFQILVKITTYLYLALEQFFAAAA